MSQLIDKLNRASNTAPQPMGFRVIPSAWAKPSMLILARLTQLEDAHYLTDCRTEIDAILLHTSKSILKTETGQTITKTLAGVPWGIWPDNVLLKKEAAAAIKTGCDFVVFSEATEWLALPQDNKTGKVLQIEPSISSDLLRTVNGLTVDAVLAINEPGKEASLTWHQLILLQRLANILTKPLLVSLPGEITPDELKALWEAGVDGIVLTVGKDQAPDQLKELHQAATSLAPRKQSKPEALLPYIGNKAESTTEEDGEEEEEEE